MEDYPTIYSKILQDLEPWAELHDFVSSDMDVKTVRAVALRNSFFKKLAPGGNSPKADEEALKKFRRINAAVAENFRYEAESEVDALAWDYFRSSFASVLDFEVSGVNFDLDFIRSNFNVGPGASIGVNSESFYTKLFDGDLSASHPFLVALYRAAVFQSDLWGNAEKLRSSRFGTKIVEGNRLFFVPKTSEISRTCCTEPLVNMLMQQALGEFLLLRLRKHFGITLDAQPDFNRELARLGSVDGSFGTIDLVSASDSISWSLVQQICPPNLLGFFRLFRCDRTTLPSGEEEVLKMISTMGNGFTFPLQTIIFACAVRAVYQLKGLNSSCPRTQFGVFGDDIVVRREAYDAVCRLLVKLGFEVNGGKSFNTGPFRESCGHDWYNGHYVRGVYIRSLETRSEVLSAINRLNRWSALADIPLPATIQHLCGLHKISHLVVPYSEQDDAGLKVPFKKTVPKVLDNYWFAYRKSVAKGRRRAVPIDGAGSNALGYRMYNPYGWVVSIFEGHARRSDPGFYPGPDGRTSPSCLVDHLQWVSLRSYPGDQKLTKVQRTSIPFWDYLPGGFDPRIEPSYGAWERSVTANLGDCLS